MTESSPPAEPTRDHNRGRVAKLDLLLGTTDRAGSMALRLRHTAERVGLARPVPGNIADAFLAAMDRRSGVLTDDHHPDYLHTARTALILMDDARMRDPDVLLAAVIHDSERPALVLTADDVLNVAGAGTVTVLDELPPPDLGRPDQIEWLVMARTEVLALHLAERLDHMRHLHLGPRDRWKAGHEETLSVLIPLADRTHPMLARRLNRWAGAFQRRFLESAE